MERRAAVRQRNIEYNGALARVCADFASRCHWDNNAVFDTALVRSDVSGDYFHPSTSGQARLAAVSWEAGYSWTTAPSNQAPVASFTYACTELSCTFDDTSTEGTGASLLAHGRSAGRRIRRRTPSAPRARTRSS